MFAQPGEGFGGGEIAAGDVGGGGVGVEEFAGSAVGLVARETAVTMGPIRPAIQITQMHIGNSLAIITLDPRDDVGRTFAEERGELRAKVVAAAFLKCVEEIF